MMTTIITTLVIIITIRIAIIVMIPAVRIIVVVVLMFMASPLGQSTRIGHISQPCAFVVRGLIHTAQPS